MMSMSSNNSMITLIVVMICMMVSSSFSTVDVHALDVDIDVHESDNTDLLYNNNDSNMIMIVQQLDDAFTQLQQEYYYSSSSNNKNEIETCIPCNTNTQGNMIDHHERLLALFPGLRNRVKTLLSGVDTSDTDQYIETMASSIVTINQVGNETSTGGFIDRLKENPLLYIGGFALALVILLPLIILEAISTTTSTPIFCILGFATSPLFGACRRRNRRNLLNLRQNQRELATIPSEIKSFLKGFFNANGEEIIPDATTDVNVQLRNLIQFGLSDGTIGYLNNVTIASAITDVAQSDFVTPIVSASLIAITPLLMLQSISDRTNTPIKCILPNNSDDCRRRRQLELQGDEDDVSEQELEELEKQRQCEITNFNCHMKNMLLFDTEYKN